MKLLILFPNAVNWAAVCTSVPILAGIAKHRKWDVEYFDTYSYQNVLSNGEKAREKIAGFKVGPSNILDDDITKYFEDIIPDLQNKINDYNPDLIAITALSTEYDFLLKFFDKIKYPEYTKIIIGGIHATFKPMQVISSKLFDLVALGEGEETFNELLTKLKNKQNIDDILGTYFYNKKNGEIKINPIRSLLPAEKLWEIERDNSFFKSKAYFLRPFDGKQINRYEMEISRGCPFNCTYCANSALKKFNKGLGKYVKVRPIESSINQMKKLIEDFKIGIFSFQDECFLSHPTTWLKEYLDQYKLHINKPYLFMTRAETVTEEKIKLLLSYNIPFQASLGVESGSEEILKNVLNRNCTPEKVIKAFKILNKYRIRTSTFFMLGLPFEKREDAFKSINICKKVRPSVASIAIYQPYPGQELTQTCIDNGFIPDEVIPGTFNSDSILTMPPPYMSSKEIRNLWKVFMLYAMLPKKYWKDIEKCEHNYDNNAELFNKLLKLRWEKYDYAEKKHDIKLV
jgi:radical SAM superfamily enzyme YgiQ (UPF0313 family)